MMSEDTTEEPAGTPLELKPERPSGVLDKMLRLFADVRGGEAGTALLLMLGIFVLMVCYYVIKVAREAWMGDAFGDDYAEYKTYAAAVQACTLIPISMAYSWVAKRVAPAKLVVGLLLIFLVCIELFYFGDLAGLNLAFLFFVWVGIFSLSVIAQFWSVANDIYSRAQGERLFPIVTVGMTAGPVLGSFLARELFSEVPRDIVLQVSAAVLVLHLVIYLVIFRRHDVVLDGKTDPDQGTPELGALQAAAQGFRLIASRAHIRFIALLLVLLNLVNTTGEFILGSYLEQMAAAAVASGEVESIGSYMGQFWGGFYFVVNIASVGTQAFLASRITKIAGVRGLLFALPVIAFANYALVAFGVGFAVFQVMKIIENAVDYSLMNNAKAAVWLPTTREEKYAAKQTTDTFFVRLGDVLSAGCVWMGTTWLEFGVRGFGALSVAVVIGWLGIAWLLSRSYLQLTREGGPGHEQGD